MALRPQSGPWYHHYWNFCHTQRRTTINRTPVDEWSVRRRDLHLTTHNIHNKFKPTISAGQQPQPYASDRAATGIGSSLYTPPFTSKHSPCYNFFKIHILRLNEFLRFVDFRSGVSEIAFPLRHDTTLLDTLFQMFWNRLMVCNCRETTIQWRSVIFQNNWTFCVFVCTRWILVFRR
jgi:hypothetical protein